MTQPPLGLQSPSSNARRVANPQRGSTRAEVKSRRQSQRRRGSSCGDGWSAWSATVQHQSYSLELIDQRDERAEPDQLRARPVDARNPWLVLTRANVVDRI